MPDTSLLDTIKQRLSVLNPHHLTLTDHSAAHAGHAGAKEFGGGHYHLCIISDNFHQMNRIQRHRLVYNILNDMIPYQIHAISIEAYTSDEWLKKQQ